MPNPFLISDGTPCAHRKCPMTANATGGYKHESPDELCLVLNRYRRFDFQLRYGLLFDRYRNDCVDFFTLEGESDV